MSNFTPTLCSSYFKFSRHKTFLWKLLRAKLVLRESLRKLLLTLIKAFRIYSFIYLFLFVVFCKHFKTYVQGCWVVLFFFFYEKKSFRNNVKYIFAKSVVSSALLGEGFFNGTNYNLFAYIRLWWFIYTYICAYVYACVQKKWKYNKLIGILTSKRTIKRKKRNNCKKMTNLRKNNNSNRF